MTSVAYRKYLREVGSLESLIEKLHHLQSFEKIDEISKSIQNSILENSLSEDIIQEITKQYQSLGNDMIVAVRSSASAEGNGY